LKGAEERQVRSAAHGTNAGSDSQFVLLEEPKSTAPKGRTRRV
jgi:hypothetical protein